MAAQGTQGGYGQPAGLLSEARSDRYPTLPTLAERDDSNFVAEEKIFQKERVAYGLEENRKRVS